MPGEVSLLACSLSPVFFLFHLIQRLENKGHASVGSNSDGRSSWARKEGPRSRDTHLCNWIFSVTTW